MCLLIAIALMVFGGFFGYTFVAAPAVSEPQTVQVQPTFEAQVPTQAISCASPSADQDISDMLAVVGDAFPPAAWAQQVTSEPARTTSTWRSDKYGAVAYLEFLHYDCGVSQEQIDQYYSAEGFRVLLSSYSSYEQMAACSSGALRLFEFNAALSGSDYRILYWVEQTSPTRVAGLMLVFPASEPAQQAAYAGELFPDLPSCQAAAG